MDLDFQPKQPERVGQLQDQSGAIQPGERPVEIGWAATHALKNGLSLAILEDVEGYIRKMYAVPDDVTAENNRCYKRLRSAVVDEAFRKMGKVFQKVLEHSITLEADNARGVI